MAQGTIYIKETWRSNRRGVYTSRVAREVVLCAGHANDEDAAHEFDDAGVKLEKRPWTGPARDCAYCHPPFGEPVPIRATVVLALALLCGVGEATAQTSALVLGNVADLVSTEIAIARGDGRVREANPIMGQHVAQRVVVKAAGTAAQVWLVRKLEPHHPRAAKALGYGIGTFFGGVAIWNLRQSRR